jgi:hypothetical protein
MCKFIIQYPSVKQRVLKKEKEKREKERKTRGILPGKSGKRKGKKKKGKRE